MEGNKKKRKTVHVRCKLSYASLPSGSKCEVVCYELNVGEVVMSMCKCVFLSA